VRASTALLRALSSISAYHVDAPPSLCRIAREDFDNPHRRVCEPHGYIPPEDEQHLAGATAIGWNHNGEEWSRK